MTLASGSSRRVPGVHPAEAKRLTPASSDDASHVLHLDCGAEIRCRVLLLALGVYWRRLEAAGTERFVGAGIYYACTTEARAANGGRLKWVSGRPGEAPAYAGTDFIIARDGRIAALYLFFDKLS